MKVDIFNSSNTNFKAKYSANNLRFKNDDFFVRIKGYGKNIDWAYEVKKTAENAAQEIQTKNNIYTVLKNIAQGVNKANQFTLSLSKRKHTGILRQTHPFSDDSDWSNFPLITHYNIPKYRTYEQRFDYTLKHPLKNPYPDISLTTPIIKTEYKEKFLQHGNIQNVVPALNRIKSIYNYISEQYINSSQNNLDISDLNRNIAEIRWILAHATPWERGSDAISNVFMRALYKACNVKTYPIKEGISLDLEAYCTELKDYKKKFGDYFDKPPHFSS